MTDDNDDGDDGVVHDEVEIEDFTYDEETDTFTYPCPCGDTFAITREDLENGEDVARCPSCSLIVRVIFNVDDIGDICSAKVKQKQQESAVLATN
ncbi:diphthamide biosynthesis protein 3-like [Oppia nitens]|uniref:diphthamide biosynthesis protein 3-like n=1 Tax=Oppia nitens TaxID=1686743 RepID=UPI0023DA7601|nr:diphthamide biosynthesis protein 3-like [Oppia nitens]